jgi:hypothetical protein
MICGTVRKLSREVHREVISNKVKELTNIEPVIKDFVLDYPNTHFEVLKMNQHVDMDDPNFNMDFLFVHRGAIEVVLEL